MINIQVCNGGNPRTRNVLTGLPGSHTGERRVVLLSLLRQNWGISERISQSALPVRLGLRFPHGLRLEGEVLVCFRENFLFELLFILTISLGVSIKPFEGLFFTTAEACQLSVRYLERLGIFSFLRGLIWGGVSVRSQHLVDILHRASACGWNQREPFLHCLRPLTTQAATDLLYLEAHNLPLD